MTLTEIVAQVAQRMNLTSDAALARIADDVRERYRWVLGTIGLATASRDVVVANTVVGSRYLVFENTIKVLAVFDNTGRTLPELTFDELRNRIALSGTPQSYALDVMDTSSVTLFLDSVPTAIEAFSADALVDTTALTGSDEPAFPNLYHDLLVYGARAIELRKMEKTDLADEAEREFQTRLSDLRMFIAKSAYLDIYQGKRSGYPWRQPRIL